MKKTIILVIILLISFTFVHGQDETKYTPEPTAPSWESYEFIKYGKVGASLYTGTVNYSVPIYRYKDNDFDFSITVDYATNGYRVNHDSGILGHGWTLSHPGMITRKVKGIPDEYSKLGSSKDEINLIGFRNMQTGEFMRSALSHTDETTFTCYIFKNNPGEAYEAEPDEYDFNFCGYSGSFHPLPPGQSENRFVMYNMHTNSQGIRIKHSPYHTLSSDYFRLVDDNGYEYIFRKGEYTYEMLGNEQDGTIMNRQLVSCWYLCEISAPNGRKIEFQYKEDGVNGGKRLFYPRYKFFSADTDRYLPTSEYAEERDIREVRLYQSKLKKVLLPDGTLINLDYEKAETEYRHLTNSNAIQQVNDNNLRLKQIRVSYNGKEIRKAAFSYDVKKPLSGNTFTFLDTINISGVGNFSFDYYPMKGYPSLGSICSDHWGYYNGQNKGFKGTRVKDNLSYDENDDESYTSLALKEPVFEAALSGCLKRINYPTGGFSELSYESHSCSKKVLRTSSTNFQPNLLNLTTVEAVGGIRISQVMTSDDGVVAKDTVTYKYLNTNGVSSGILLNTPRYGVIYEAEEITTPCKKHVEIFDLSNGIYDYDKTHIEYTQVRQYRNSRLECEYFFNSYVQYPDIIPTNENMIHIPDFWFDPSRNMVFIICFDTYASVHNLLRPVISLQYCRGLLSRQIFYDKDELILNENSFYYSFPLVMNEQRFVPTGEYAEIFRHPRQNIELSQQYHAEYNDIAVINYIEEYNYNKSGSVKIKIKSDLDEAKTIERYYYVGDSATTDGIVGKMRELNLFSYPLRQETCIEKGGKETLLGRKEYTYIQPNPANESLIKVGQVKEYSGTNSLKTVTEYEYDNLGYVRQQKSTDGVPTSYLWSYNGKFPVVKAGNVAFAALQSALAGKGLGITALRDMADVDNSTFGKLLGIRSQLSASPVEVFKYDPTAGMTERTASNSLKTFYNYDRYARLISITDNNGETLEKRSYNIVTLEEDDDTTINGNNE